MLTPMIDHHVQHYIAAVKIGAQVVLLQLQPHHVLAGLHPRGDVSGVHHLVEHVVQWLHPVPDVEVQGGAGEGDVCQSENKLMIVRNLDSPGER